MPGEVNQGKQWDGASERVGSDFFFIATVDGSGRVTIPSVLRTLLSISSADYVRINVSKLSAIPAGGDSGDVDDHIRNAKVRRAIDG